MLAPVLVTPPAANPVSLEEAKAHLRVDWADDDALIEGLIAAATQHLDGYSGILGRALVTQTWQIDFAHFYSYHRLPLAPVPQDAEIVVTYYDVDNAQQTIAGTVYELRTDAIGPLIALRSGQSWPALYPYRADAARITFTAGYGDPADVPAPIKAAILMLVGHWYENREASVVGVSVERLPMAVDALLAPYRRPMI